MLGKIVDRFLGSQDELDKETQGQDKESEKDKRVRGAVVKGNRNFLELGLVFILALVPRLLYIYVFSNPNFPGWYTDVFHHWQIAYLSKEVGFHESFLRLWDFKGMEFFWGLLHPLIL